MSHIALWQFLAGLGFFLYGMNLLEDVLKNVSGRRIKLFLKRNTQNLFKAVLGGTLITGIVQSSSVVSLIVLAFVEAGIITFRNALAVMLGANLGTTLDSWLVTFVGFKVDILDYAFPVIAVTSIGMFFLERRKNLHNFLAVFFALGILFMGLDHMKQGAMILVQGFDITTYATYSLLFFVLIGFVLTTIIQSSSATIAITLTAIYVGALTLPAAAAVVIGSEVGTTIKILLWGMKGSADKKRVAWGNFIYNIFTSIVAFLSLNWVLYFIEHIAGVTDPLVSVVFFQSSVNIVSIMLFLPFLTGFSNWLERTFRSHDVFERKHKSELLPLLAIEQMRKEVLSLLAQVRNFNRQVLCLKQQNTDGLLGNIKAFAEESFDTQTSYRDLKQREGSILDYYTQMQDMRFSEEDTAVLLQHTQAVRLCIYSAKAAKDVEHNMKELEASISESFFRQREIISREWIHFDTELDALIAKIAEDKSDFDIDTIIDHERFLYEEKFGDIIKMMHKDEITEIEVSTLMNIYREVLSSKKSLLRAVDHLHSFQRSFTPIEN